MRSTMLAGRQLLIQAANGASWYFGAQLPAELVAHFSGLGQTIVAAQIMRFTNNFYFFVGMVLEAPSGDDFFIVEGHVLNLNVTVDTYTHFDDPTNLASLQIATGPDIYQVRIAGGGASKSQLLFDYLSGADNARLGNLNNHLIVDNVLDRILIETDDSIQINAHGGGRTGVSIEALRHITSTTVTASTTTSTTYVNLSNIAGVVFVAPLSGIVTIHWASSMSNNNAGGGCQMAPRIGEGSSIGAGTLVLAASNDNASFFDQHATVSEGMRWGCHLTVSGLTAGATYNVSMQGRAITAGTASFSRTHITVIPSP